MRLGIDRTRRGLPAAWEAGGGRMNTGDATIVAGPQGEPLRPLYIRGRGHLANGSHALFAVRPGFHVIQADHHRGDFAITVYRLVALDMEAGEAEAEVVARYDRGEWEPPLPPHLEAAVEAAQAKARCYHCRHVHYFKEGAEA